MRYCHACGGEVDAALTRVGRRDACDACEADLHCCLNCKHHDPFANNQCNEPGTEPVRDRVAGNFCDAFEYRHGKSGESDPAADARAKLEALFAKK